MFLDKNKIDMRFVGNRFNRIRTDLDFCNLYGNVVKTTEMFYEAKETLTGIKKGVKNNANKEF